jgi:hypothetical protein
MTDQICTCTEMHRRGAAAFVRGLGRDDHNMNAGAPAIEDWQKGHDAAKAAYTRATMLQAEAVKVSPP